MIAPSIGPVETRLLILQDIAGDDGLVVASDGYLGDIAEGRLAVEFPTFLLRSRPIAPDVHDPVVGYDEHDGFAVDDGRDLTGRPAVGGLVWTRACLSGGEVRKDGGILATARMKQAVVLKSRLVIRCVEIACVAG